MGTKRERGVDEEHRDNPEERGRAANKLVTGTGNEAQSEQQMALIAWKCWGGGVWVEG